MPVSRTLSNSPNYANSPLTFSSVVCIWRLRLAVPRLTGNCRLQTKLGFWWSLFTLPWPLLNSPVTLISMLMKSDIINFGKDACNDHLHPLAGESLCKIFSLPTWLKIWCNSITCTPPSRKHKAESRPVYQQTQGVIPYFKYKNEKNNV